MSFGSRFDGAELAIIGRLTERRFNLSHSDARILLPAAEAAACEAAELFHVTGIINGRLSFEQRVELIEMSGQVGYADRRGHPVAEEKMRAL
jgi:uncharacterized tellurite resistance protein B-like protein